MGLLTNIVDNDAFSAITLTEAITELPYTQSRIGELGIFEEEGVATVDIALEYEGGRLQFIKSAARGSMPEGITDPKRTLKTLRAPHLPQNGGVMADDVQGKRVFGAPADGAPIQIEMFEAEVAKELMRLKQNHEYTWEYHRMGCLSGKVLDGDGSTTLYDLFSLYGITRESFTFTFATTDEVRTKVLALKRGMKKSLGKLANQATGIHAFCSDAFFDALVKSADAKTAYNRWQDGQFHRDDYSNALAANGGFEWLGVHWENYDNLDGADNPYITSGDCNFIPMGVPGLFKRKNAPAPFIEAVNTIGLPMYAKQKVNRWETGVEIHTNSNPLHYCLIPSVLKRGVAA